VIPASGEGGPAGNVNRLFPFPAPFVVIVAVGIAIGAVVHVGSPR
jgi:hypothetical protein